MEEVEQMYGDDYYLYENETFDYASTPYIGEIRKIPLWEIVMKSYLYAMIIFFSLVGNTLIIVVVLRNKRMRTTTNYYIVNLAVADILVTVFCTWVHLVNNLNSDNWVLGSFFCKFNTFSQVLCLVASVLSLTLIAYDRFFGIVFALKAHMTNRKAHYSIAVIWICSLAIAAPLLKFRQLKERKWLDHTERWCDDAWPVVQEYNAETNSTSEYMPARTIYFCFVSGVLYFFPMLAMIVAYSVIIRKLSLSQIPGERVNTGVSVQQKTKRKVIAMLVTIMSVFGICWLPYQIVLLYAELRTNREPLGEWFFTMQFLAGCFAYSNSALNPLIYAGFNENFKQGFAIFEKAVHSLEPGETPSYSASHKAPNYIHVQPIVLMKTEIRSPYSGSRRFSTRFSTLYLQSGHNSRRCSGMIVNPSKTYSKSAENVYQYRCLVNGSQYFKNPGSQSARHSIAIGNVKLHTESYRKHSPDYQVKFSSKRYLTNSQITKEERRLLTKTLKTQPTQKDDESKILDNTSDSSRNSSPLIRGKELNNSWKYLDSYKMNEKCRNMPCFAGVHFHLKDETPTRI